jgi:hypothetical protein
MTPRQKRNAAHRRATLAFDGPKGICRCGHTGNGRDSEHADLHLLYATPSGGDGYCTVPGCHCTQFEFAARTPAFEAYCQDKQHNVP